MQKPKVPVRIRPLTELDLAFVFNSWLKSVRSSKNMDGLENVVYYGAHHKLIEGLLQSPTASTLIACSDVDPTQIYGYVCSETVQGIFVLHHVYVKQTYRKLGVARQLLEAAGKTDNSAFIFTHRTEAADALALKYNAIFHPYYAYYGFVDTERKELSKKAQENETESN